MIDYIQGKLTHVDVHFIVVETGGIGYQVITGNPFQYRRHEGEDVRIYTYQYVREDALALYGFRTRQERTLFEKLLQVSGVGPKAALALVATASPAQIAWAIQNEDLAFLTKFPGIGKKTAQRLIVDLKDKVDEFVTRENVTADHLQPNQHSRPERGHTEQNTVLEETLAALQALGYGESEVRRILPELKQHAEAGEPTEAVIKRGLKLLMD
ncbi:Holliday junction ATP-dependent DNA helicase RuvA [Caldalkalibacillus thermarum]|uniref:Holliday junction branch migration protein RuvA n=1 Tax=Caldalkalibacillus thermarum TaxID=296745 RepID=UPI00166B4540|nr:Holliday junction branch migration protein RuvA [Caldalkalibacillus thermarum]GGK16122.1 Holliday junction ATP-dependent DNA helicase RuvA [Caldalkalibacillus thermarum]